MFKTQIKIHFMRLRRFLNFSLRYFERHKPLQSFQAGILNSIKDILGIYKKAKMAKFRVTYQQYQLNKMEKLIAQSNEHFFLKGQQLNETR